MRIFVCGFSARFLVQILVRIFRCGFFGADFWCGFFGADLMRIFYCAQSAERIFGEIFLMKNLDLSSWSLRPSSLSTPWLNWHDFDLAFRNLGPSPPEWLLSPSVPPNPPSPRRLWPGQAGQSLTSPSCLPSPSPEGPQSMVNFPGDFLGEILALPSKCFGTPRKNPCKNPCKNPYKQFLQTICAEIRAKKSGKKNRAKNPCRKSVQKIRAKIREKNPCRKSAQKSVQKICAKQTRANGFPKVTLQIEKPNIQQENLFVLFFCKLALARFLGGFFSGFFFARRPQGEQQKKSSKKSSPKSSPNFLSKNPPQNPPQIPLRIFAVGPHLDSKEMWVHTVMPLWRLAPKVVASGNRRSG